MNEAIKNDPLQAWRLLLTAHSVLTERVDKELASAEVISLEWYDVLVTLEYAPDHRLRLGELAGKILLSKSGLTRLVDRLEKAGYIRRESCPDDRRGFFAVLTPEGLAARERAWPTYRRTVTECFARHLEPEDAARLTEIFSRLLEGMGRGDLVELPS